MRVCRRVLLLTAGVLLAFTAMADAQGNGSIFGKVTDTSGGVMPGVTVTVTGTGLQRPLTAVTGATGTYQFPTVPIGTYTVTFELSGFKKVTRPRVDIVTGFNAQIDPKLEVGAMTEEVTVSAAAPVVDTKKTSTGATFSADILEKIPTARDPWQIINMTPGVQAGLNVGGSSSGQQVGLASRGTGANVQWNLEGGSITDLSSNSSPSYFNFDSFSEIQVTNGGGDVSVQSLGPVDQPRDQERQQRVQGLRGRHVRERQDAGAERHQGALRRRAGRLPLGPADQAHHQRLGRVRRADHEEPAVVLGRGRRSGHQQGRAELLRRLTGIVLQRPDRRAEGQRARHAGHVRPPQGRPEVPGRTTRP